MSRFHQQRREDLRDPEFADAFYDMSVDIALLQMLAYGTGNRRAIVTISELRVDLSHEFYQPPQRCQSFVQCLPGWLDT